MEPRERATSRFHANVGGVESTEAGGSGPRRGRLEDLAHRVGMGRRVLGEGDDLTLSMRANYALALHVDDSATIDDLREAVTILEETERTVRRVLGGQHPTTDKMEQSLRRARAALAARE